MRWNRVLGIVGACLSVAVPVLRAEDPVWVPISTSFSQLVQAQPAPGAQPAPAPEGEPPPDLFAQAGDQGPAGSSNPGAGHPQMIGDLNGGIFVRRALTFPTTVTLEVTRTNTATNASASQHLLVPSSITREVNVPLAARGPFKIGENESPLPTTRAYTTYNYFNNVAILPGESRLKVGAFDIPQFPSLNQTTPTVTTLPGLSDPGSISGTFDLPPEPVVTTGRNVTTVRVLGFDREPALRRLDVHREVFGFEQACFDNNFSVGVRLPLIQQTGEPSLDGSHIGDVSAIFKYALINDAESGTVVSAGLMVTAPTGEGDVAVDGKQIHPTLVQPYVGYFANFGQFYVQGFSSLIVPTDSRDSTLLSNDVAVGYRIARDESEANIIRYIAPTLEAHLTTPLDNRDAHGSPGGFPDIFVATAGVHLGLGDRTSLTVGASTPLTGPQPFDAEGIVQFNFRF